jgi:LytR cell envelope-related transcriptional attenuator
LGTVTEDNGGNFPKAEVQSPEEVARKFLESGEVMDYPKPGEVRARRNWLPVVGIVGACAVLAVLVAIDLLPTSHVSSPPHAAVRTNPTVTVPEKTVKSTTPTKQATTTTTLLPVNSAVQVTVLNASASNGLAALTAAGLTQNGFTVSSIGTAPNPIAPGQPSQILYGPTGLAAAHALGNSLSGPVSYVVSPGLTGTNVTLLIANSQLTVVSGATTTTGGVSTTSTP